MKKKQVVLLSIFIILFLILAFLVTTEQTTSFDNWFYQVSVQGMNPVLTEILIFITHLGDTTMIISIALVLLLISRTRKRYGVSVAITTLFATLTNTWLKLIFMRERPDILRLIDIGNYSFPSGHAMVNAALYGTLILLVYQNVKNKTLKYSLLSLFTLVIFLIGFSRVYLGVHYITDVLGGWILGFVIASLSVHCINKRK